MTFMSIDKISAANLKKQIFTLIIFSLFLILFSTDARANTCSKSDIDYYLQRGFTNAQVVQLCAGAANQNNNQRALVTQATTPAQTQQSQQSNQLREDQSYLSAALDADRVTMNSQNLTLLPRECIEYGPPNNIDLVETICVNTKLKINFSGMQIGKASKGLFLVKDATVKIRGTIQRELLGINELRRQDREAILETLKTNPREIKVKIRRGIDPGTVANRLKKYVK